MKKVYFAASIRGGRADAALYRALIGRISLYAEVLTEHIGSARVEEEEAAAHLTDADIYRQDIERLRAADLLIAEATCPSLGVGYELAYAERIGVPCIVLYRPDVSGLSAMIAGDAYYSVRPYRDAEEAFGIIDGLFAD